METGSWVELLAGSDEIKSLFRLGYSPDCLDSLGYDFRLGEEVRFVTTCKDIKLSGNEEIEILPNETVIVRTEEILDLPDDVFAIGSPKMSLLIDGLWAHGGKTDPGYNSKLTLGFQNVGSKPCKVKRGQRIFHLTFFKVHNKKLTHYAGSGPGFSQSDRSPLDDAINWNDAMLEKVKQTDGIKSYRITKVIFNLRKEIQRTFYIPLLAYTAVFVTYWFQQFGLAPTYVSFWVTNISGALTVISIVYNSVIKKWRKEH